MAFLPLGRGWAVTTCFPAAPTHQHPAGTWSSGTCHHRGLGAATPPHSHPACRDPLFPCPPPALLPDHPLCAPARQRDLDLPPRDLLLPRPQSVLAPLGCNTNYPIPAGHREPQNPPYFFGGESRLHDQLPQAWGPGSSMGVTVAAGAWGTVALFSPKSTCPFCISARCGRRVPAVSLVMAAGDRDGGGAPPLQGRLI